MPDIFQRLSNHGIRQAEYGTIKRIVTLNIPQDLVFFQKRFGDRTIAQVLNQVDRTRRVLAKDFVLSTDQRNATVTALLGAELCAWKALLARITPGLGPWILNFEYVLGDGNDSGEPNSSFPGIKISARNRDNGKTLSTEIPADELRVPSKIRPAWTRAFTKLGIWNLIWNSVCMKEATKRLVSARQPQGWSVFTQQAIPELYEFMLPFYKSQPHHSRQIDKERVLRTARFPKELFRDMVDVLRVEHPDVFGRVTERQLVAVVQRYLTRRPPNY